ncbi:unnamed protein product [Mytilus coruscus]|uniref:Uncharacterized protein n=1 Tax=Mytilus coruscus TaxID=42192 RepID=A0A6J8BYB4_MYTCO|nr:unnamed protein product [Mytilus coruscus]
MFGMNDVWSFHDSAATSNNRTSDDIHPSDTAKLLSNFPSHDRKDNIITELHSEPDNTLSSITQLLLQNPGVIPGGVIDLEAKTINNIIRPIDSLKTKNKTATAKGYVINSPQETTLSSVSSALSLNIIDEGLDLKKGNRNTLRKIQRPEGSVNHFQIDQTNNILATGLEDFHTNNAKETETRFHNLLKTGKTDKAFRSTNRDLTDDRIQFKVVTANLMPEPNQVQFRTSQTKNEITTTSTKSNNSEIDGIIEHAITNSLHQTDIGDKVANIPGKSVIDAHHSNIDDILKYQKITSAIPLNVAHQEKLTSAVPRNLSQYHKLASSIQLNSAVTKTVPLNSRRVTKKEHSYSDDHNHNKNNISTLGETRDNSNVMGKGKHDSSKLSPIKRKNHKKVSHIQNKIMNGKSITDSRMNQTSTLPRGSESTNSIENKMETNVSKLQRLSPSFKTKKSNSHKALLDTSVVTTKKRKRRRRKYKNGRQSYLKNNDTINYKESNKSVHVTKENTTSEYNLTSEIIHKHILKPKILGTDNSNRNLTKIFELEKKQIQPQKVKISRGSKNDKGKVTGKHDTINYKGSNKTFHVTKENTTSEYNLTSEKIHKHITKPKILGTDSNNTNLTKTFELEKKQLQPQKGSNKTVHVTKENTTSEYNLTSEKIHKHITKSNILGTDSSNITKTFELEKKQIQRQKVNSSRGSKHDKGKVTGKHETVSNRSGKNVSSHFNQSKISIPNSDTTVSSIQQSMIIGSTNIQTDMANKRLKAKTEQANVKNRNFSHIIENMSDFNTDLINKDMNANATSMRFTNHEMNGTQRNNNNDKAYDSNKTDIFVKLSEVQITGIPIPFRRYSKLTTPSYRTTTILSAKETNKEPVSMSKSDFSTPIPATMIRNYDINERNKTADLENSEIHEYKNDSMPTGDQRDRNNIMDDEYNRLELLSTNKTVNTHTKDISQSNDTKSTHSNYSPKIINKESFVADKNILGNSWERWLGSLSTNDKYPLQIEPRFENKTRFVFPVQNSTIIDNKLEPKFTSTLNLSDFTKSPEMYSDVSNKYASAETTTAENIDAFNNLDYHSFVGKSEVVANKQSTNVSKISGSTSNTQEDLLTKWNALLQQFRKDNSKKKSKLVQLLQNKSKSKNLKERHDVRFQKKPKSGSKYVRPTVEWLGIYKDLIKNQDKNVIPVSNKQRHRSVYSSLHDENVHSQFVKENLKTNCKEDQSYKLALDVLQTILMNMNNIKPPVPRKAHKRRYLLIPLGPENPDSTQMWADNEYTNHRPNDLMEERKIYPSDGRIPYRIRPQNPSVHMSVHSSF